MSAQIPPLTPSPQRQSCSKATEIIPRLYISDLALAEDAAALSTLGITHLISAMRGFVDVPKGLAIHRTQVPLDDFPFSELAAHLPVTTTFLHNALRDPNAKVLVHCVQGISRSASVVSAFLIAEYGWTPAQAIQYIKSKRRTAEPNFGFVSQLQEYANSLRSAA